MEAGRNEGRTQRVHLYQGSEMRRVAKIVGIQPPGQCRAGSGFNGHEFGFRTTAQPRPQKWKGDTAKVAARITSYNVCYTKLLRTRRSCLRQNH